jgi:2-hydroxy-6-oxonona-2,4-dienedioate hydrolase
MLLLGSRDTSASEETGKSVVATLPDGEFHVINGAGHLPWLEKPEECGSLIKDFLKKQDESGTSIGVC